MATAALSDIAATLQRMRAHSLTKTSEIDISILPSDDDEVDCYIPRRSSTVNVIHDPKHQDFLDSDSEGDLSPGGSTPSYSVRSSLADVTSAHDATTLDLSESKAGLGRKVAILGVGYVGLHLTEEFGKRHNVTAFDVSAARIETITPELMALPLVKPTSNERDLAGNEFYLISVPTLVRADETVDTSYIESAIRLVERYARPGATVVIESSVAVGMTRQLLAPLIKSHHLKGGMSPERVDPGRTIPAAYEIPKIVSGLDDLAPGSLAGISALYATTFNIVHPVSAPEVAEMTKLYENCQRMINIAYANEMADACIGFGIDPFEVCRAAETKPFGYSAYRPSAGVGGHCIPVNPFYLFSNSDSWSLLQHATKTMNFRPAQIADRIMRSTYKRRKLSINQIHTKVASRVLVAGVGFKPGQSVLSNSPGLAMMKAFSEHWDAEVHFADPLVKADAVRGFQKLDDADWTAEKLSGYDAVVVVMLQHGLDFGVLENVAGPVVHYCCQ